MIKNPTDLKRYLADLHSDDFRKNIIKSFKDSGSTDSEASELADIAISYYEAAALYDKDKMRQYNGMLVEKLSSGSHSMKETWTMQDAINAATSTAIMVSATGGLGAVSTAQAGNVYIANSGINAIGNLARVIERYDVSNSREGAVVSNAIKGGQTISGTQAFEIIEKQEKRQPKTRSGRK